LTELIPTELIPFVWFGGIAVTVYVFFHKFSDVIKAKISQSASARRKEQSNNAANNAGNQFDSLVKNAPRILDEVNKDILTQRANGVSDDQMKGLLQKKQIFELATQIPPEVYDIIGKPFVKKIIGMVGKI
tara:strand:+ start:645 stop:1037 length:393 start_codon:yes stop_codon:yes gene_type:complete